MTRKYQTRSRSDLKNDANSDIPRGPLVNNIMGRYFDVRETSTIKLLSDSHSLLFNKTAEAVYTSSR